MLEPKTVEPRAQSTYIYRVQSNAWRLPNYWPPTPSPPSECVLPPRQRGGRTHSPGGVRGWGVNISEDARHWIGLLQYNPSTAQGYMFVLDKESFNLCRKRTMQSPQIISIRLFVCVAADESCRMGVKSKKNTQQFSRRGHNCSYTSIIHESRH